MAETILAVYETLESAQQAVNELVRNGYDRADIGLAARDVDNRVERYVKGDHSPDDVEGAEGAGFGALVGGLTGLVLGLTAITIPGIGAVIAAGPLAAVLGGATGAAIGATAGAVTGGVAASLIDLGVPDDHAEYYAESVRRGSALVSVTVRDNDAANRAMVILRNHRPVDVERRATQWKMKGWKGFDPTADPYTSVDLAENPPAAPEEYDSAVRTYNSPHA
jgi:uncharacterized membrane protein